MNQEISDLIGKVAAQARHVHEKINTYATHIKNAEQALVEAGACVAILPQHSAYESNKLYFTRVGEPWRICATVLIEGEDVLKPWTDCPMAKRVETYPDLKNLIQKIYSELVRITTRS